MVTSMTSEGNGEDDRIHAILIEPQLARFRRLCGLDGVPLTTSFEGWHRHAVLAPDRVCLFPRDRSRVPGLRHEAIALEALDGRGVPAPRLVGRWDDREVSPYPFLAVTRLPGQTWSHLEATATLAQVETMLASLGRAIAAWHRLDRRSLPPALRRRNRPDDLTRFLATSLDAAIEHVARLLDLPAPRAAAWRRALAGVAAMAPALVHGDVNEGQILVDDDLQVTGILDWETAQVGHPLKDFDFGEWGYGIFAWDRHFDRLHRALWDGYAAARGGVLPPWQAVHLCFCVQWADWFGRQPEPTPWQCARLATTLELLRRLEGSEVP
jgi:aminoglycoside phosphotransferase (APT) family kinase protein